jgi:hypothetical protein
VNFNVTASGDGTVSYQWQKDTVNIGGATSSTLQITNVSSVNAGSYRCVVTAGCGSTTSNAAALTVKTNTTITSHPQNQTVPAFGSAGFSVAATGTNLTYQWQKNSVNLANGGSVSGATTATLQISPAAPGDAGSYRCVVTGDCGALTSNAATLTVLAVLADNFESYANQAAFEAVWLDTTNSAYFLDTAFGNPGRSINMPSPAANSLGRYYRSLGGDYTGSDANPLIFSFDFYLDTAGGPNWSGARQFLEIRGNAGTTFGVGAIENLVAIGVYTSTSDTFSTTRYQGRVVNGSNWQTLDPAGRADGTSSRRRSAAPSCGSMLTAYSVKPNRGPIPTASNGSSSALISPPTAMALRWTTSASAAGSRCRPSPPTPSARPSAQVPTWPSVSQRVEAARSVTAGHATAAI